MGGNAPSALGYNYLSRNWKKGLRNGNWPKLNTLNKALYMASLSLAKMRGRIVNLTLILRLQDIIDKLRETTGQRLTKIAYKRAMNHYNRFVVIGLFDWAPQVRLWFNEPAYLFWLGLCSPKPLLG